MYAFKSYVGLIMCCVGLIISYLRFSNCYVGLKYMYILGTRRRCSAISHLPGCFCPWTSFLSEYRIQHGAIGPLNVTSSYSTWIFCRGVSGFATDCPCGVNCYTQHLIQSNRDVCTWQRSISRDIITRSTKEISVPIQG